MGTVTGHHSFTQVLIGILCRWIYANWLLFKEEDDPRDAVNAMGAGWSANSLDLEGVNEWETTTLGPNSPTNGDNSSVASTETRIAGMSEVRRTPGGE